MQHENNKKSDFTSRMRKPECNDVTDDDGTSNCVEVPDTEIQQQDDFNAKIIKQTVNSVTIDWNLIQHADVYKIEKYNKKDNGWTEVAW